MIETKQLEYNLYQILLDFVHAFVIDDEQDGLIVIDSGYPYNESEPNPLLSAISKIGKEPANVKHVLITHAHPDHIGNVGLLQEVSGATIWMSETDAPILEDENIDFRPVTQTMGSSADSNPKFEKAIVQKKTHNGDIIPLASGFEVIDTPGHCLGQQAFLWKQHKGVLFTGDTITNENDKMKLPPSYESIPVEKESVRKLLDYRFDKIAFGHGNYISKNGDHIFKEYCKTLK